MRLAKFRQSAYSEYPCRETLSCILKLLSALSNVRKQQFHLSYAHILRALGTTNFPLLVHLSYHALVSPVPNFCQRVRFRRRTHDSVSQQALHGTGPLGLLPLAVRLGTNSLSAAEFGNMNGRE